ncbi:MAG: TIR domain-containing protein, partial [Cyanobacteria bacterium J06555_13]
MSRIFISYRRTDSISEAGRIYDFLYNHFGRESIFKDVDDIDAGDDFRERVKEAVGQCQVLLAVIGKSWLTAEDSHSNRRLDNPADWVRLEIETALTRKVRVIPVLLQGVDMPPAYALPESIQPLAFRNAARVRYDPDFRRDMDRVIKVIERHLAVVERTAEPVSGATKSDSKPASSSKPQVGTPQKIAAAPTFTFEAVTVNARGQITQRKQHKAEYLTVSLSKQVSLDLVKIPGGTFQMGSPASEPERRDNEGPQHSVNVPSFWMGKYPVTQAQWKAIAA